MHKMYQGLYAEHCRKLVRKSQQTTSDLDATSL